MAGMNRAQIMMVATVKREIDKLVGHFNGDGYARFGVRGDEDCLTPVETAIRAMREFDEFLGSPVGADAFVKFLHSQLVEKGLVPA